MNWRQDLLLINFFQPIEQAATMFFQARLGEPHARVVCKHKIDIANGGLTITVLLMLGADFKMLESAITYNDKQIEGILSTNPKMGLQDIIGISMFQSTEKQLGVCEAMFNGLVVKYHQAFKEFKNIQFKPIEDATVDGQVQA